MGSGQPIRNAHFGKKTNHIARKLLTMLALSLSHDFGHSLQQRVQTTLNHFRFVNFSTAHTCTTVYMYSKPFGNKPESFLAVSSGVSLGFATLLSVMISTKLEGKTPVLPPTWPLHQPGSQRKGKKEIITKVIPMSNTLLWDCFRFLHQCFRLFQ